MIGPLPCEEFEDAVSAEASPAEGVETAAQAPSTAEPASAVEGPRHVWLRADQIVAGDVVVPKYGSAWVVELSQRSRLPGFWQVRSAQGRSLVVLPDTPVLVRA